MATVGSRILIGMRMALGFALAAAALQAQSPPAMASELVVAGLQRPVFVTSPPEDLERLFVLEQTTGRIRIVRDGALLATPFLDLGGTVHAGGGERGLLGLAFHPQHAANGAFFVHYNNVQGEIVVARYAVGPDRDVADPLSAQILFQIPKPTHVHNGGMLAFGPDGMLYISTGDGGGSGFSNPALSLNSLLGKLLRVDVDGGVPYAIPPDNPHVGVPNARGEIWARGLRNPWRFGFDRLTGDLHVADVGADDFEEVNWIPGGAPGGANFGWHCLEGTACTGLSGCFCPVPGSVAPIHGYTHDTGCAIVGGYVYRGALVPELSGAYVHADYCTGRIFALRHTGPVIESITELSNQLSPPFEHLGQVSSLGEDGAGELYILSYTSGKLWRIVPAPAEPDCDGDGIPDAAEIAAGGAFDYDNDGIPDDCELELFVDPLVAGQSTAVGFLGGQPGESTFFLYSTRGIGSGTCYFQGAVCLNLLEPVYILGVAAVDIHGAALIVAQVPAGTPPGLEVSFQALLYRGPDSLLSNAVMRLTQ